MVSYGEIKYVCFITSIHNCICLCCTRTIVDYRQY